MQGPCKAVAEKTLEKGKEVKANCFMRTGKAELSQKQQLCPLCLTESNQAKASSQEPLPLLCGREISTNSGWFVGWVFLFLA